MRGDDYEANSGRRVLPRSVCMFKRLGNSDPMIRYLLRLYEPYVAHLEAEVEYWRRLYEHERRRADRPIWSRQSRGGTNR